MKNFEDYTLPELNLSTNAIKFIQEYFSVQLNRTIVPFYGTLLGIVREQKFIKNDNDIDMVWISNGCNKEEILEDYILANSKAI